MAIGTTVLAGGLDQPLADAATGGSAVRYRGSHDGKIFVSRNGGRTWQLFTDFGKDVSIPRVESVAKNRVVATLTYRHHDFKLALRPNSRSWRTVTQS
jgi:hypothetical protein